MLRVKICRFVKLRGKRANTGREAIFRLASLVSDGLPNTRFETVLRNCSNAIDIVIQCSRQGGKRGILEVYAPRMEVDYHEPFPT